MQAPCLLGGPAFSIIALYDSTLPPSPTGGFLGTYFGDSGGTPSSEPSGKSLRGVPKDSGWLPGWEISCRHLWKLRAAAECLNSRLFALSAYTLAQAPSQRVESNWRSACSPALCTSWAWEARRGIFQVPSLSGSAVFDCLWCFKTHQAGAMRWQPEPSWGFLGTIVSNRSELYFFFLLLSTVRPDSSNFHGVRGRCNAGALLDYFLLPFRSPTCVFRILPFILQSLKSFTIALCILESVVPQLQADATVENSLKSFYFYD